MIRLLLPSPGPFALTNVINDSTGDVPELVANPSLAERELNFHAKRDLEEMCRDQWNWQSFVPLSSLPRLSATDWHSLNPCRKNPQGYEGTA